jgi:GNAT superfamily N-acetyltransferase
MTRAGAGPARGAPAIARSGGALAVWFRALRQRRLDLTFRASGGIRIRIVERPAEWMAPEAISELLADIALVAARTLPSASLDYGIFKSDGESLSRAILTILYDEASGRPIAFNALAVLDVAMHGRPTTVTHLGLVMVDPEIRGHGLSWILYGLTCLILFVRNQFRPLWLSNVTQVPAVVGMVAETFSEVFPGPDPAPRRSFEHLLLARQIMARHRSAFGVGAEAGFDEARFVISDAYTGGSDALKKAFAAAPKHRREEFNDFCARELDYQRGDDVLQIGRIDLAASRRYLLNDVPRTSLPGLLATLGFLVFQRVALPVLYWFTADKPWGVLRPWTK